MIAGEPRVRLFDFVTCLSEALDLVSDKVVEHQARTALLAHFMAAELGLSAEKQVPLVIAGALHDVGALSLKEKLMLGVFDMPQESASRVIHAERGYALLKRFEPFAEIARMVRFHHVRWDEGRGAEFGGEPVPLESHILELADRAVVLLDTNLEVLGQVEGIRRRIRDNSGRLFKPDLVDAFLSIAGREHVWLEIGSRFASVELSRKERLYTDEMAGRDLLSIGVFLSHVIDFRSPFTATHTSEVAAVADALAECAGMTEAERWMMRVAGYIHDLGKLGVPTEILDKPGPLDRDELFVMRSHPFHTHRVLEAIPEFATINTWGSLHHERLDGSGYPFHLMADDLPLGSRIMAVADVFSALTQNRPYRKGFPPHEALEIVQDMAGKSAFDSGITSTLNAHLDEIDSVRRDAQVAAATEYEGSFASVIATSR